MSADHEFMKCEDVKKSYGNPGNCCPFPSNVKSQFTVWKWTAITRVSIFISDILTPHTFMICIHFLLVTFVSPYLWFRSGVSRQRYWSPDRRESKRGSFPLFDLNTRWQFPARDRFSGYYTGGRAQEEQRISRSCRWMAFLIIGSDRQDLDVANSSQISC